MDPTLRARVAAYASDTGQTHTAAIADLVRRALDTRAERQAGAQRVNSSPRDVRIARARKAAEARWSRRGEQPREQTADHG